METHSVLLHFFDIIHFCVVARHFYSRDDGELASQPVHMLIPWFYACSRSNTGHNPQCVSLWAQSSGMTELERNKAWHTACRKQQQSRGLVNIDAFALTLLSPFLHAISD